MQLRILPEDFGLSSNAAAHATTKVNVQVRDVVVSRNDYKTADTFTAEIDYKSFPFDPRIIRACGVVIYMQDMGSIYNQDTGKVNIIIPGGPSVGDPNISNAVFIGFVDENEIVFDDAGRKVLLSGRDTTALLIDQKYTSQKGVVAPAPPAPAATTGVIPGILAPFFPSVSTPAVITQSVTGPFYPNLPLNKAILKLLSTFPATANIQVYSSPGVAMPVINSYDPNFGDPMTGGMNTGGGKRETYWDIIQELAGRAGLICYMGIAQTPSGDIAPTIYLVTPKDQGLNIDPKTGKQSTVTTDDIKIIYGNNVKNLRFKRKIGRLKNFNIQVVSRSGKEVISCRIPFDANQNWCTKYGIPKADVIIPVLKPDGSIDATQNKVAPSISFPYTKIANKAALVLIGQMLYEQYSLQQLEGSFSTWEMLGRGTTDTSTFDNKTSFTTYDMTQIKKGQTICIEIDPPDLQEISRFATAQDKSDYLTSKGYDSGLADLISGAIGKMSPRFQIKSYKMQMNESSGFQLDVDFYNLIDNTNRTL
jgi:hypothetical protein